MEIGGRRIALAALVLIALLLVIVPRLAHGAACHDEADRLADRHALRSDPPQRPQEAPSAPRAQAQELLNAARKADDDGIVEQCLRQLAEARALIETGTPPARPKR